MTIIALKSVGFGSFVTPGHRAPAKPRLQFLALLSLALLLSPSPGAAGRVMGTPLNAAARSAVAAASAGFTYPANHNASLVPAFVTTYWSTVAQLVLSVVVRIDACDGGDSDVNSALRATSESLAEQSHTACELIVVETGSCVSKTNDATLHALESGSGVPRLRHVRLDSADDESSATLIVARGVARGDVLVHATAGDVFDPSAAAYLIRALMSPRRAENEDERSFPLWAIADTSLVRATVAFHGGLPHALRTPFREELVALRRSCLDLVHPVTAPEGDYDDAVVLDWDLRVRVVEACGFPVYVDVGVLVYPMNARRDEIVTARHSQRVMQRLMQLRNSRIPPELYFGRMYPALASVRSEIGVVADAHAFLDFGMRMADTGTCDGLAGHYLGLAGDTHASVFLYSYARAIASHVACGDQTKAKRKMEVLEEAGFTREEIKGAEGALDVSSFKVVRESVELREGRRYDFWPTAPGHGREKRDTWRLRKALGAWPQTPGAA